jgi:radical SAM-linked protein
VSAENLATTALPEDVPLPWNVISGTVERDFLRVEWEKAKHGESTPDCRWNSCAACGACAEPPANDLAQGGEPSRVRRSAPAGAMATTADQGRRWRYVATFSVTGRGRFIGHLDRVEVFRRAVRRAGGRLALSGGMRPKPLLGLALPLAVGVEGQRELCEFELAEAGDPQFSSRLKAALPRHMTLLGVEPYEGSRSVASRVTGVRYQVGVSVSPECLGGAGLSALLTVAAGRLEAVVELPVEEEREGRLRRVDVKRYVQSVSVEEGLGTACILEFRAAVTPSGTARPERVVEGLGRLAGRDLTIEWIQRMQVELE